MRTVGCSFLVLISAMLCLGQEGSKGVRPFDPALKITKISQTGRISLEISNSSKEALKLWEKSNSWGAADWRVLRIRGGRIDVFFQNPYQVFTANAPTFVQINPGAHIESTLDINGGDWCGLGHCSSYNQRGLGGQEIRFKAGDTIVVVYDVPPTKESQSMQVWHGVAAASTTVR